MRFITFLWLNLRRRKSRSLLTASGVAVAVGTAVALLGISVGFERSTAESFGDRGVEIVVIQRGVLDQLSSDLDENLADRIAEVPGVGQIARGLVELIDYPRSSEVISILVQGWEPGTFLFEDLTMLDGRVYEEGEQRVALLGKTLADNIRKKVGDTIDIQGKDFEVIGIYDSFSVFEKGAATVPLRDLQEVMVRGGSVTGFSIRLDHSTGDVVDSAEVCERINELIHADGESLGVVAMPTMDYVKNSMHLRAAHAMAWFTSAIAIFVGSIGMLNTMLMSVIERIKEISILRAIGWRKSRVVRMILGECMLLSLCGAALGTLGAIVLTKWLATWPAAAGFIKGEIYATVIGIGFLIALLVGLVGGIYPAYRATQLRPVDGLSHE